MTRRAGLWVAGGAVLLLLASTAAAALCEACKGKVFIQNIGKCVECGGPTRSGAFKLCPKCSRRLAQCEHCRAPLKHDADLKDLVLGKDDDGRTVSLVPGQRLIIRLAGNPTTGYQWQVSELKGEAIEQVSKVQYVPRKVPPGTVGSGGTFIFTFRGAKGGRAQLALVYVRPWEKGKKPIRTFAVSVEVRPREQAKQ